MAIETDPYIDPVTDRDAAEPLGQNTRRERTWLLIANGLLFAMVHAGLIPREIEALGLRATSIEPKPLVALIQLIVAYLGCAFMIGAWADFTAWRAGLHFLRDRKDARAKYYLEQIQPELRNDLAKYEPALGSVGIEKIIRETTEKTFRRVNDSSGRAWARFSRAYRWRAIYETVIPVGLTVANLVASIPFLVRAG